MTLTAKQAHVLGRVEVSGTLPADSLRGGPLFAAAVGMSQCGILRFGNWSVGGEGWRLSSYGMALIRVIEGRDCEWCGRVAIDARETQRAGCFVFFCQHHREIADKSSQSPTSERGSLYGLVRTGGIKPRQPDEVTP